MSVDAEKSSPRIPKAGDRVNIHDLEEIWEAIEQRQKNFKDEPREISFAVVFFNIGDRYAPVSCVNGEWEGLKKDLVKPEKGKDLPDSASDLPRCPNGHVLTQGVGLQIGWMTGE